MSLFEQFFSDINKDFMYDMVCKIFLKDHKIDIRGDRKNYELMEGIMDTIFKGNNFEDISDINESLLKTVLSDLKNTYIDKVPEDTPDFDKSLERLMEERNRNVNEPEQDNKGIINEEKSTPVQQLLTIDERVKEENNSLISDPEKYIPPIIKVNSNKRINIQSSRYNYIIDLKKEGILSTDLLEISKLIIPIEDNYIFNIPLLLLNIKELKLSVYLQQDQIVSNKNSTLGIYKPIEDYKIEHSNVDRITIDIRDMTGEKYKHNDILKINIVEIKDNIIIFTCSNVNKNNYKMNDMIKVLNLNSYELKLLEILSSPLKVSAVKDNMIFCSFEGEHGNKTYNNTDMKIINISNQNLLIFNQSS